MIHEERVSRWLEANVDGVCAPFRFDMIAGGRSNITYKVTDANGRAFVLRRPPTGHVLATAHDSAAAYDPKLTGPKYPAAAYTPEKLKAMKGIDADHPQVWTADYGKGRVFSITLGHDEVSLHFQPLQTLILRGTEWAATGKVTLPVLEEAKDYPTK